MISANDNLWGSYYYDPTEDIARLDITPQQVSSRENLSYEFSNRTGESLEIAMEWERLRVPFRVNVDLHSTTLAELRAQLRGHHANSWGAWYSAAQYCFRNNIEMEQGLAWINRAISGGYNGFRAQRNFATLYLKSGILRKMGEEKQADQLLAEAEKLIRSADDYETLGMYYFRADDYKKAIEVFESGIAQHPRFNGYYLGLTRCHLAQGKSRLAKENAMLAITHTPQHYKAYVRNYLVNGLKMKL